MEDYQGGGKFLTGRMLTVLLFTTLSVAGIGFSIYLFYVANNAYTFFLAVAFTFLSLVAGFFNIYASVWYYRSQFYDDYLAKIKAGLKPVRSYPNIAVVMPIYNEDPAMVDGNLAELMKINYPKEKLRFMIADDSTDPGIVKSLERISKKHGVRFIHRNDRAGFKAGALNNAVSKTNAEFIAIFDCDERLTDKDFLLNLLPYFQDPGISYVQTEKRYMKGSGFFSEAVDIFDAFFFKFIQPARAFNNTAVFAGSCALIRHSAIDHIGGFPEFVIEDTFFSFESDLHKWKSLYVPEVYAYGRPIKTFTELVKQQWRYNYGDTQFISYFYKKKGALTGKTPLTYMDYYCHGFGLNYLSVVLILFTLISVGIVFSAVPFAHIDVFTFFTQNLLQQDLEILGFFAFTLSLLTPVVLTKIYFKSWSKGFMVFLLNYALAFVRTKAAIATLFKKNPGINWNRLKIANLQNRGLFYSLYNTKTEIAFASVMFGLAYLALSQSNLAGGIWLAWYGVLYSLTAVFLYRYG